MAQLRKTAAEFVLKTYTLHQKGGIDSANERICNKKKNPLNKGIVFEKLPNKHFQHVQREKSKNRREP